MVRAFVPLRACVACLDWADSRRYAVISHLSVGEHAIDEEGFQRTMRYIFTFIEKVTRTPSSRHVYISLPPHLADDNDK
jgi:hypothetical protein